MSMGRTQWTFLQKPVKTLELLREWGLDNLPVCMAKTQYSFSHEATELGAPTGFTLPIRELRLNSGAGFIVAVCGSMMTMPGLPIRPAAMDMDMDEDGRLTGVFSDGSEDLRQLKASDEGVRLRIDHADDLWTLAQICRVGSNLGMLSHRRDSTTGTQEGGRAKSAERKPMWIEIDVSECSFQAFTDNLRVHGVISEAKIDIGSHHTHIIAPGDEVEISFEGGLPEVDRELVKSALAAGTQPKAGLVVVENDEVLIFEVSGHGIRDLSSFSMRGGGKRADDSTGVRRGFFERVARETKMVFPDQMPLVICGPGMAREQFEGMLRAVGAENQILNAATSIGGRAAANEVLAVGAADAVLGEHELVRQVRAIEDGLTRISTNGAVSYGLNAIEEASEQGAVETLIVEASLLRSDDRSIRSRWDGITSAVTTNRGEVIQASIDHDAGQQLVGMGGAIALLRWKVD